MPVHGCWLNMAKIKLIVIGKPCLNGRIGDGTTLRREQSAPERERNRARATIDWRFTAPSPL